MEEADEHLASGNDARGCQTVPGGVVRVNMLVTRPRKSR